MKPKVNIKGANKDGKIYVKRSTTLHNLLLFVHTLWMNYVTDTFLLVSPSVRSKKLCFVHGQGQKSEQKYTKKNFVRFPFPSNNFDRAGLLFKKVRDRRRRDWRFRTTGGKIFVKPDRTRDVIVNEVHQEKDLNKM